MYVCGRRGEGLAGDFVCVWGGGGLGDEEKP